MSNYLSLSELKSWKIDGSVVDLSDFSDEELQDYLDGVENDIENITGDIFYSKTATYRFDGNGRDKLFYVSTTQQTGEVIPYKNISTTSLKLVSLGGTVEETLVEDQDFVVYPYFVEVARLFDQNLARTRFVSGLNSWPAGQRNIQIEGTWGHSSVPYAIKKATALLTLEEAKPQSTKMAPRDIKQHAWPDLSVTFRGGKEYGTDTGFGEVDRLLRRYINHLPNFVQVVPQGREDPF